MEDVNDDFGELYADVEFQASSAINGVPDISQLCVRQQQQEEQQPLSNELSNDSSDALDSADDGSGLGNDERREKDLDRGNDGESEVVVESGSDSDVEDDFDVVVNDDDVGAVNGRECRHVGEDDEKEFVAVTTEANSLLKNQDRVDGGGAELSASGCGGEKGHAGKNGWVSQYRLTVWSVKWEPTTESKLIVIQHRSKNPGSQILGFDQIPSKSRYLKILIC